MSVFFSPRMKERLDVFDAGWDIIASGGGMMLGRFLPREDSPSWSRQKTPMKQPSDFPEPSPIKSFFSPFKTPSSHKQPMTGPLLWSEKSLRGGVGSPPSWSDVWGFLFHGPSSPSEDPPSCRKPPKTNLLRKYRGTVVTFLRRLGLGPPPRERLYIKEPVDRFFFRTSRWHSFYE